MTPAQFNATGTYAPPQPYTTINPMVDSSGRFTTTVALNHDGQPGLYHVRTRVHVHGREVIASDVVVEIRQ